MDLGIARRLLRLVGLGLRSRGVVVGVEQVRGAVKKGHVALAIVASDASQHSVSKVVPLLEARGVRVLREVTASDLGQAVGREQTAAVAIVDKELARGIRALMDSASDRG